MFILIPQSSLSFLVTATLFVPLFFSFPVAPSCCNNHHPIVLALSVNCEQILMSPQFHSALAAFACHLPARKDTQLAIIPSLSPPWLITVLFPSLPALFSHLSHYFLIFSASRKKSSFSAFLFFIIWQSHLSLLLSLSSLTFLPKDSSFYIVFLSNTNMDLLCMCIHFATVYTNMDLDISATADDHSIVSEYITNPM